MTSACFLTEDSYLGGIAEALTLNRYNCGIAGRLHQGMLNMQSISDIGLLVPAFDCKAIRNDIEFGR